MLHCRRFAAVALLLLLAVVAGAQNTAPGGNPDALATNGDSDGDGLSDGFEQAILQRFQPSFLIPKDDCSTASTAFAPDVFEPTPLPHTEGTVYGQVFPSTENAGLIEVHYYHLWARDCGQRGHLLDAERVSALLGPALLGSKADSTATDSAAADGGSEAWKALYWFASAHEGTVCDSSRIHTAASLQAETAGPRAWISKGKHASYLERARCSQGCGADKCVDAAEATPSTAASSLVINLGEPGRVMNGAIWASAASWPLSAKMQKSDFSAADLELLRSERLSAGRVSAPQETSIAVGPRPMRGFQTAVAIASEPPQKTAMALDQANQHADSAIQKGAKQVRRSLKRAFTSTVDFVSGR